MSRSVIRRELGLRVGRLARRGWPPARTASSRAATACRSASRARSAAPTVSLSARSRSASRVDGRPQRRFGSGDSGARPRSTSWTSPPARRGAGAGPSERRRRRGRSRRSHGAGRGPTVQHLGAASDGTRTQPAAGPSPRSRRPPSRPPLGGCGPGSSGSSTRAPGCCSACQAWIALHRRLVAHQHRVHPVAQQPLGQLGVLAVGADEVAQRTEHAAVERPARRGAPRPRAPGPRGRAPAPPAPGAGRSAAPASPRPGGARPGCIASRSRVSATRMSRVLGVGRGTPGLVAQEAGPLDRVSRRRSAPASSLERWRDAPAAWVGPLAQRGELALERRALALQRPQGLGLLSCSSCSSCADLSRCSARRRRTSSSASARPASSARIRSCSAAGRAAIAGGGLLLGGGLLGAELRHAGRSSSARARRLCRVGEPLGRERQVALELAELDPQRRRVGRAISARWLSAADARARGLLPAAARLGDAADASRGQQLGQLPEARLHARRPLRVSRSSSRRASVSCTANFSSVSFACRSALPRCRARLRICDCTSAMRSSTRWRSHGGLLQPALGAVLPVAIEPDARRLLEERAPLVGAVGEEQVDHLRLDDDARVAAEAGAAEQVLDVAEPDRRAVEQVVALPGAREPPGDDHLAVGDGEVAVGVVEEERDLGDVDRAAGGGALEDHVLHLAAAEQPRRLLAQHPAHGVGDVATCRSRWVPRWP